MSDVAHGPIQHEVEDITIVGDPGEAAPAQEAIQAPFERPGRIARADIVRAQKFPRECVNTRIGQQRLAVVHTRLPFVRRYCP